MPHGPRGGSPRDKVLGSNAYFMRVPAPGSANVRLGHIVRLVAGECRMAHYRLYFLRADDLIGRALDLDCPNDKVAIAVVAQHDHSHAMELWSGKRKVRYFPAPEGDWQVKMMGGERRDRSAELGELAKSVRDLITSDSDPQASAAYEAMAAHLDHQQADALQSEDERLGRRSKEA